MKSSRRFILLTPALSGADGISEVARGVREALADQNVTTLSLGESQSWALPNNTKSYGARKLAFCWDAARESMPTDNAAAIVMHVHLAPAALPLLARGAKLIVFLHGVECWRPLTFLEALAVRKADSLLANSRHTAESFRSANPQFSRRKIHVCHLGVSPATPAAAAAGEATAYALIVGRMVEEERYKGHDKLLELWPRLLETVPGARLIVAGDGNDRRRLQEKAEALGLARAVRFEGRVSSDRLAQLYSGASFFVMPSTGEGFGIAYLEAMRYGVPCIAAPGAAEEIIAHGVSGFIVDPDSPDLVATMQRLFTDSNLRQNVGRAAAARFAAEFTSRHFHERLRRALGLDHEVAACAG